MDVTVPDFFKELDKVVGNLDEVRTYLNWRAVESAADALGKAFVDERFRFNRALTGAKQILPRWKRCTTMTDRALGEALGRSFVAGTGEQGKIIAKEMITGIEKATVYGAVAPSGATPAVRIESRPLDGRR